MDQNVDIFVVASTAFDDAIFDDDAAVADTDVDVVVDDDDDAIFVVATAIFAFTVAVGPHLLLFLLHFISLSIVRLALSI